MKEKRSVGKTFQEEKVKTTNKILVLCLLTKSRECLSSGWWWWGHGRQRCRQAITLCGPLLCKAARHSGPPTAQSFYHTSAEFKKTKQKKKRNERGKARSSRSNRDRWRKCRDLFGDVSSRYGPLTDGCQRIGRTGVPPPPSWTWRAIPAFAENEPIPGRRRDTDLRSSLHPELITSTSESTLPEQQFSFRKEDIKPSKRTSTGDTRHLPLTTRRQRQTFDSRMEPERRREQRPPLLFKCI